jgi:hypothetical protein
MTQQLRELTDRLSRLSEAEQRQWVAHFLEELESERKWDERFARTTEAQWDRMIADVEREIEAGETRPLDDAFPPS